MGEPRFAVLGAGVIGLTTAIELKKEFRNSTIEIIADKFYEDTTSIVAAGIFLPSHVNFGKTQELTRKWIQDSYYYWNDLSNSYQASAAGVKKVDGYILSSEHPHMVRNEYVENLVPTFRKATKEELKLYPGNWNYGSFVSTLVTDNTRYLKWAMNIINEADTQLKQGRIDSFGNLSGKYDVIINCTGLGSQTLCNDSSIVPLRGQVMKVEAPWIKQFVFGEYNTYIIPGFDAVTLGGCRQYEDYNLNVNKYDYLSMKERCENLIPSLKKAKLIKNRVGLRPHRVPVRIEKELVNTNGTTLKIVHNYGHGGYGVTTAPGTALYTVQLVKEMIVGNHKY